MIRAGDGNDLDALRTLVDDRWYWSFFTDDHYAKIIAERDGSIIGVACVSMTLGTANLDFIYVSGEHRSAGVGAQLLEAVRSWCRDHDAEGLGVNCAEDNGGARRFYEREGFTEAGRVRNYLSNGIVQVFYRRDV